MSNTDKAINRRWFLRGAGGVALAIPPLHSLLPAREARAADATSQPIFVAFANRPSNAYNDSICPSVSAYDEVKDHAGVAIQRATLRPTIEGGVTKISDVLQAPSALLTSKMVSRMNILRGLDFSKTVGHNNAYLGNLAGVGVAGEDVPADFRISIDQVMANSSTFYRDFQGVRRAVLVGRDGGQSHGSWTRTTATGPIVKTPGAIEGAADLFKTMFGGFKPRDNHKPVVDLVKESFVRLSRTNTRLSSADKARLTEHVALVADLERRSALSLDVSCSVPGAPSALAPGSNPSDNIKYYNTLGDIIVAALACGLTRVAVFGLDFLQVIPRTDMHTTCEHNSVVKQAELQEENRRLFAEVILPFADKLDARKDATGRSLLDRSLILRSSQMGEHGHNATGAPFITIGSADGAIRTGNYLDYRDLSRTWEYGPGGPEALRKQNIGLPVQHFFGSILRVMGVPHQEWAEPNHGGYGKKVLDRFIHLSCCEARADVANYFTDRVWSATGDVLPWFGV